MPVYEPPKKVFYGQALSTAFMAGTSNFINGYLDHQDFAVTCLNFTGFLMLGMAYKLYIMKTATKEEKSQPNSTKKIFFYEFYDFKEGKICWEYTRMVLLRIFLCSLAFWTTIMSIYYAKLANINFGIISCCFIFSIVINITCGYAFF